MISLSSDATVFSVTAVIARNNGSDNSDSWQHSHVIHVAVFSICIDSRGEQYDNDSRLLSV